MAAVVVLSNVLVQHPFAFTLGRLNLADLLTWGAFSYPLAFLVTDITNRLLGPRSGAARRLLRLRRRRRAVGLCVATPRIAIASGHRRSSPDSCSTSASSTGCASAPGGRRRPSPASLGSAARHADLLHARLCAGSWSCSAPNDPFAIEAAPFLGLYPFETPRWISWALGDFAVKLLIASGADALPDHRRLVRAAPPGQRRSVGWAKGAQAPCPRGNTVERRHASLCRPCTARVNPRPARTAGAACAAGCCDCRRRRASGSCGRPRRWCTASPSMLSIWCAMPASSRYSPSSTRADRDRRPVDPPQAHGDAPARRIAALQEEQVAVGQEAGAAHVEVVVRDDLERARRRRSRRECSSSPRGGRSAMATISPAIGEAAGA